MSKLDSSIRLVVEEIVDNHINDPSTEDAIKRILTSVGIEPSLETTLAYLFGTCFRAAIDTYRAKYNKKPSGADLAGIIELMNRRSMELRHSYLSRRMT